MKRINLIPPEYATGKKAFYETGLRKQVVMLGGILAVGLTLHYAFAFTSVSRLRGSVEKLKTTASEKRAKSKLVAQSRERIDAQMQNLAERRGMLEEKQRYLRGLESGSMKWSELLTEFTGLIPDKAWLDELVLDRNEQSYVRGGTFDNKRVAEFISALNRSLFFTDATFIRTETGELDDSKVINFELGFTLTARRR